MFFAPDPQEFGAKIFFEIYQKKVKKSVDNGGVGWYISKAVARERRSWTLKIEQWKKAYANKHLFKEGFFKSQK